MNKVFHPAAYCPDHGIFEATAFAMSGEGNISFAGCGTTCPVCNGKSEILSGRYEYAKDTLSVLLDKSVTPEALKALLEIVTNLDQGNITPLEAHEEAVKLSPAFSGLFNPSSWSGEVKAAIIGSLMMLIPSILNGGSSTTINNYHAAPAISRSETPIDYPITPLQGPIPRKNPKSIFDEWKNGTAIFSIPIPSKRPRS